MITEQQIAQVAERFGARFQPARTIIDSARLTDLVGALIAESAGSQDRELPPRQPVTEDEVRAFAERVIAGGSSSTTVMRNVRAALDNHEANRSKGAAS